MSVGDRKILSGEPNAMTSVAFGIVIAKTSIPLNAVLLSVWMAQFSFFLPQSRGVVVVVVVSNAGYEAW